MPPYILQFFYLYVAHLEVLNAYKLNMLK
jgi:hypothetical protein